MKFYKHDQVPFHPVRPGAGVKLLHTDHLTVATWKLDQGGEVPRHTHPEEQTVCLLQGRIEMFTEQGAAVFEAGDRIVLAGNEPHAVKALEDSIIIDIFSAIREDLRAQFPALAPAGDG